MPKGNPDPVRTKGFLAQQQPKYGDRPLGKVRSVRFTAEIDQILEAMPDRQQFIRNAVNRTLQGGHQDNEGMELEQLQEHINAVLLSIPPKQRKDAAKLFKKLTDRISEIHS